MFFTHKSLWINTYDRRTNNYRPLLLSRNKIRRDIILLVNEKKSQIINYTLKALYAPILSSDKSTLVVFWIISSIKSASTRLPFQFCPRFLICSYAVHPKSIFIGRRCCFPYEMGKKYCEHFNFLSSATGHGLVYFLMTLYLLVNKLDITMICEHSN